MGCGCGGNVTQGPRPPGTEGVPVDDGTFAVHGSGGGDDVVNNTAPISRASGFVASAAGTSLPAWASRPLAEITTAVVVIPLAPVPQVTIRQEKPSHERMVEVAKTINAEQHARSIALVQLERTSRAMCFTCPVLSADGTTCLLAPKHPPSNSPKKPFNTEIAESAEKPLDIAEIAPSCIPAGFESTKVVGNEVAHICKAHAMCPLGRHPAIGDDDEVVRWAPWWFPVTMRWYGVPEPLRWLVTLRRWRGETLNKCGCSVLLKKIAKRRGLGWVGKIAEGVQLLRKDMTAKKVFSAGPTRVRRRALRYARFRAVPYLKSRVSRWLGKE